MNIYAQADCLKELGKTEYDYAYISPPCYEDADNIAQQLGGRDVTTSNPSSYKTGFLDLFLPRLKPRLGTITVAFTGDRRSNSRILPKNFYFMSSMFENGYYLKSAKYAVKGLKANLYSSQIIHILTFQNESIEGKYNLIKNKLYKPYGLDMWGPFKKEIVVDGEVVGQPFPLPQRCIEAFTDPSDIVLDPFAGIGTTLEAARRLDRGYVGYEIRPEVYEYGKSRYQFL